MTVSDVARLCKISNRQVHDLVDYGYLNVAQISRNSNRGLYYLFSEKDIEELDIHSHLAEIKDLNLQNKLVHYKNSDFKRMRRVIDYYDSFLERIHEYPEHELLRICFFLYHLNHYAKTYKENNSELYSLKNRVLKKMYTENPTFINATYLLGPDRKKIWLCDDCKEAARAIGSSYPEYIKKDLFCPKCFIQSIEKEYYSLIEFVIQTDEYRFNFHLPRSKAVRWIKDIDSLPQDLREAAHYEDRMYLYGRRISRIEEKAFPLSIIIDELNHYISFENELNADTPNS